MKHFLFVLFAFAGLALFSQELPMHTFQPDYHKWKKVKIGDSAQTVIKLLGNPRIKLPKNNSIKNRSKQIYIYGCVVPKTLATPPMFFSIHLEGGMVCRIDTPFGGIPLSEDGKPTTPLLISPANGYTAQYPGVIDFRWFPSSGKYPVRYLLQVDTPIFNGKWNTRIFHEYSIGSDEQ